MVCYEILNIKWFCAKRDAFYTCRAQELPAVDNGDFRKVGDAGQWYAGAYDAGTEANTENLADIVPPCSGFVTGTDMSNPNLATNGVVTPHAGIQGTGTGALNLDVATHGWSDPVAKIVITRTS